MSTAVSAIYEQPPGFWRYQVVYYGLEGQIFDQERWRDVIYILGALFFSIAIFKFQHPASANMGNFYGIVGMLAAIGATLGSVYTYGNGYLAFIGFVPAAIIGIVMAWKVKMTGMPQMVGLLNALGGLSAALESFALYVSPLEKIKYDNAMLEPFSKFEDSLSAALFANDYPKTPDMNSFDWGLAHPDYTPNAKKFAIYNAAFYILGMIIGTITFTGSLTACLKLAGKVPGTAMRLPARKIVTLLMMVAMFGCAIAAAALGVGNSPAGIVLFVVSAVVAAIYGVLFVLCIGGADMPVVISVLNSLSGWSTVFAGLTFNNSLMIIAGTFVGASGIILSIMMCKAMNRSLKAVLLGDMGSAEASVAGEMIDAHIADAELCAKYLAGSRSVVIIPGYGMAVSRAQHVVASLAQAIRDSGRNCRFAAHPVAGRLPGHMNVLLSEASVPYDTVDDLDAANPSFKDTDTCIVIGANDTVNPSAVYDKGSPIYGMPVLECWHAKRTIVIKRSLKMGYAGIENPLFFNPSTSMLLGDGKDVMETLLDAFKAKCGAIKPDDISPSTVQFIQNEETRVGERYKLQEELNKTNSNKNESSSDESSDSANLVMSEKPERCVVGVLKDVDGRVYLVPKDVIAIQKKNWEVRVVVAKGAGKHAGFTDAAYEAAGAAIAKNNEEVIGMSHIILKISTPTDEEVMMASERTFTPVNSHKVAVDVMKDGEQSQTQCRVSSNKPTFICAFGGPFKSAETQKLCKEQGVGFLSSDIMPRVTAAQAMDVLSSSAMVAGYRAVLECCNLFGRLPGAEITAAGSYAPAKMLVVGVGVAGLKVIGTAHAMGIDVRAFDVRKETADQVTSLGGKFLMLDFEEDGAGAGGYANIMSPEFIQKEMELFSAQCEEVDFVITTAAIPGRRAPILLKDYHIAAMKAGSIVIDLAAPTGGNVETTKPGENWVTENGVKMIGKVDFVQQQSAEICSEMLSGNVMNWFNYCMTRSNNMTTLDMSDSIIRAITLTYNEKAFWPAPRPPAPPAPKQVAVEKSSSDEDIEEIIQSKMGERKFCMNSNLNDWVLMFVLVAIFVLLIFTAPAEFLDSLMAIILGAWTGFLLVSNVTSALHTPLMSLTNAISGVVILAGILASSPNLVDNQQVFDYLKNTEPYAYYADHPTEAYGMTVENVCTTDTTDAFYQSMSLNSDANPPGDTALCAERGLGAIILNSLAIFAASLNVVGGFSVTKRMLGMFVST